MKPWIFSEPGPVATTTASSAVPIAAARLLAAGSVDTGPSGVTRVPDSGPVDQVIDGKPDSREGRFRIQARAAHTQAVDANAPGTSWEANNTIASNIGGNNQSGTDAITVGANNPDAATATGRQYDEDRVTLLTAHWMMDQ